MKRSGTIMKKHVLAAVLGGFVFGVNAGDIVAGEKKAAEKACLSCHGKDYKSPIDPSYPIIAGQHEDYLYNSLKQYKRGAAQNKTQALSRGNAIMAAQAAGLSPKDMRDIAAYLASLPGPLQVVRK
jgi:cytochrome c553